MKLFSKTESAPEGAFTVLLIGVDGDSVEELVSICVDDGDKRIRLRSLRAEFSGGEGPGCPAASASYRAGGAPLLKAAASQKIGREFDGYVLYTYQSVMKAADVVGGLNLRLGPGEIEALNGQIAQLCRDMGKPCEGELIPEGSGETVRLDGLRTAAFLKMPDSGGQSLARIRRLLSALKRSLKGLGLRELGSLAEAVLPALRSDIPRRVMIGYMVGARKYLSYRVESE